MDSRLLRVSGCRWHVRLAAREPHLGVPGLARLRAGRLAARGTPVPGRGLGGNGGVRAVDGVLTLGGRGADPRLGAAGGSRHRRPPRLQRAPLVGSPRPLQGTAHPRGTPLPSALPGRCAPAGSRPTRGCFARSGPWVLAFALLASQHAIGPLTFQHVRLCSMGPRTWLGGRPPRGEDCPWAVARLESQVVQMEFVGSST